MGDPSARTADPRGRVLPAGPGTALQGVIFLFWAQGAGAEQDRGPGRRSSRPSGKTETGTVTETQCARRWVRQMSLQQFPSILTP